MNTQTTFLETLRKFCVSRIEPSAREDDAQEIFRRELYQGIADLGVTAMAVPEEDGGLGLPSHAYTLALKELGRVSVSYGVTVAVSGLVQSALIRFGTEEQKSDHLPDLMSGKKIGAFALTEPTSGSDAASLKTRAEKQGNHYVLHGSKQFITSGGIASLYLVMARTPSLGIKNDISAFIVPADTPGLTVGKKEVKMGWRASPTTAIHFDHCKIPAQALLGGEGQGFKVALTGLDPGRINIAALAIGLAERALEEATRYACERVQFEQPIIHFQGVGFMLADMEIQLQAAHALLAHATQLKDAGETITTEAAALKCFATDMAMKITTDAVQILGGYGYTADYPLERYMRDAKVLQIVEGTNQIQRLVISRQLQKKYGGQHL